MRIVGTDALAQDVGNSGRFHHGSHAGAGDDTGAGGGGLEQDMPRAEAARDLERNAVVHQRHPKERLLGVLDPLANGLGHLVGLAQPVSDHGRFVAYHHQRIETEAPSTLYHLGHAADVDDLLLEL